MAIHASLQSNALLISHLQAAVLIVSVKKILSLHPFSVAGHQLNRGEIGASQNKENRISSHDVIVHYCEYNNYCMAERLRLTNYLRE